MPEFEIRKDRVILSPTLFADYKNPSECFGNTAEKEGYCEGDENCTEACCDLVAPCKQLCGGIPGYEQGKELVETALEVVKEPVKEPASTPPMFDRESVKRVVVNTLNNLQLAPEVTSSSTRDKIFIATEEKFIVTNRALRLPGITDGAFLGIGAKLWKEANKGIDVEFDGSIDWVKLTQLVVDKKLPEVGSPPPVTLFDTSTPQLIRGPIEDIPELGSFVPNKGMVLGNVTKSLQVLKFDNGYTEVRVTFLTDALVLSEVLTKMKAAFE